MKHILLIVALAAACSAASMYMTVTPDSHLVIVNAARDTLWKSSDVVQFDSALVAGSAYSLVGGTIDQKARDTANAALAKDSVTAATRATLAANATNAETAAVYSPAAPDSTLPLRADGVAARPVGMFYFDEMMASSPMYPWTFTAIASGTRVGGAMAAGHVGYWTFLSSTSANSGGYILTSTGVFLLAGNERCDFLFALDTVIGTTTRIGFHDATDHNAPTDGVYFQLVDTFLCGVTASNASRDTTASRYRFAQNTYYWGQILLNANATIATFSLYNGTTGATLWTDTLSQYIPTGAGRTCACGVTTTNSGVTAFSLLRLDYMDFWLRSALGPPGLR